MLQIAVACLLALPQGQKADIRYMTHAAYLAETQESADRQAPKAISLAYAKREGIQIILTKAKEGLFLALLNGGAHEQSLMTGDGDILGYLEAKDKGGRWQPIEYHWFYHCGNSFIKLVMPAGRKLTFDVAMPKGSLKTQVRWHYQYARGGISSNGLELLIPPTRFWLSPTDAKKNTLTTGGPYPMLCPKRI